MTAALRKKTWGCFHLTGTVEVILGGIRDSGVYSSFLGTKGKRLFLCDKPGERVPCLHEHAFDGQRTASGYAARCCPKTGTDEGGNEVTATVRIVDF